MADLVSSIVKEMNGILMDLKQGIDEKTPEDTKNLLGNNKIQGVIKKGNVYIGRVYNDTDYAKYVEYGVKGKKYSYQKPKGNKGFYTGVGAGMFARTVKEKEIEIINKIKAVVNQQIALYNKSKPGTRSI